MWCCHSSTIKCAELRCELDYAISFWSWILSWKYPHFVEISTFCGYYLHFVEISMFRGYYPHFVYISIFRGNIHVLWILSAFRGNIHVPWILSAFHVFICILWRLSAFRGNIHVPWILSVFRPFYLSSFTCLVKLTGATGCAFPRSLYHPHSNFLKATNYDSLLLLLVKMSTRLTFPSIFSMKIGLDPFLSDPI